MACAVIGWLFHHGVWPGPVKPTVRVDSVQTVRVDTVKIKTVRADTVYVTRVDSTPQAPRWWTAVADTTVEGYGLHVEYNSPLPLAARGFFSDIVIEPPPRLDSVRTVTVTVEKVIVEDRMAWEWLIVDAAVFTLVGTLIGRAQ